MSSSKSVRIGGRGGGGSATTACALFADKLPLLPLFPKRFMLFLLEVEDERSRLLSVSFLSWVELLKAFLNLRPGDPPRFFPPRSSGISNADAGCVADLVSSASGLDSDAVVALGPLTADSTSACTPSVSVASTEVVWIKGEVVFWLPAWGLFEEGMGRDL